MTDPHNIPSPFVVRHGLNDGHGVNSKANVRAAQTMGMLMAGGLNEYSIRDALNTATLSGGSFLMSGSTIGAAYNTLFAQYEKVSALRKKMQSAHTSMNPESAGGQLPGVVKAARRAELAVSARLINELLKTEAEMSLVLNGMKASFTGQAATDAAMASMINGAGA